MNRKRRDTKGKFTNNIDCLPEELKESQITKENGLNWNIFLKIIIILVLVIFSSPWMFIFSRNASIHNFAGRIGNFLVTASPVKERTSCRTQVEEYLT